MNPTPPGHHPALRDLAAVLRGSLITDADVVASHTRDQSQFTDAGLPIAVVRAADLDDVVATVQAAVRWKVPIVPRGAGSGLAGGANALDGGLTLDLSRMNHILEIDQGRRLATVEPGVINGDLDRAARAHGLFYPPDPGSRAFSTIGGNLATNAGGMCCLKYGVTADHVAALTAVTGEGTVIRTGSLTTKDVAGLNLTSLIVGSEGTLAVIVEATVRLRPLGKTVMTAVAVFEKVSTAVETVLAFTHTHSASALEIMDRTTVQAVNATTRMGMDEQAGATLLAEFDGPAAAVDAKAFMTYAAAAGAEAYLADSPEDGSALMQARREAYPSLERLGATLLDDVCVPIDALPQLLQRIEVIATEQQLTIGTFGHAGDGNLHPMVVFDPADPDQRTRARRAFTDVLEAALRLGGTVSGEHGVGQLKRDHLHAQVGPSELDLMHGIKKVFDPHGILNPGCGY